MAVIARLLGRQILCGVVGWGLYLLLAAAARPAAFARLDAATLLKLAGLPLLGFSLVTLGCAPLLALTWRWRHWWLGTVASAIAAMIGAGVLYTLSWEGAFTVRAGELLFLVTLALPIAALAVVIHGRTRMTDLGGRHRRPSSSGDTQ